jgi:hypothetical protein
VSQDQKTKIVDQKLKSWTDQLTKHPHTNHTRTKWQTTEQQTRTHTWSQKTQVAKTKWHPHTNVCFLVLRHQTMDKVHKHNSIKFPLFKENTVCGALCVNVWCSVAWCLGTCNMSRYSRFRLQAVSQLTASSHHLSTKLLRIEFSLHAACLMLITKLIPWCALFLRFQS